MTEDSSSSNIEETVHTKPIPPAPPPPPSLVAKSNMKQEIQYWMMKQL